jgi:hypothetical protein
MMIQKRRTKCIVFSRYIQPPRLCVPIKITHAYGLEKIDTGLGEKGMQHRDRQFNVTEMTHELLAGPGFFFLDLCTVIRVVDFIVQFPVLTNQPPAAPAPTADNPNSKFQQVFKATAAPGYIPQLEVDTTWAEALRMKRARDGLLYVRSLMIHVDASRRSLGGCYAGFHSCGAGVWAAGEGAARRFWLGPSRCSLFYSGVTDQLVAIFEGLAHCGFECCDFCDCQLSRAAEGLQFAALRYRCIEQRDLEQAYMFLIDIMPLCLAQRPAQPVPFNAYLDYGMSTAVHPCTFILLAGPRTWAAFRQRRASRNPWGWEGRARPPRRCLSYPRACQPPGSAWTHLQGISRSGVPHAEESGRTPWCILY